MKLFRIDHPTGYIELNIGGFFGTADKKRIKKVLSLAGLNCNESQRLELIEDLENEISDRKSAIEKLENHRREMVGILVCFHISGKLPYIAPSSYEKALGTQVKKLAGVIDLLREDVWLS